MARALGLVLSLAAAMVAALFWPGGAGSAAEAPATSPIRFTDIAPRSRLAYRSNNSYTGRKYFPQPMCGGVAVLDFDNDGRLDLFFTNGAKLPDLKKTDPSFYNCLARNRGDGTFEDVTAAAGLTGVGYDFAYGVAAGDYDNDGHTDLFLCHAGSNALFHNDGNGKFTDVTARSGLEPKARDLLSICAAFLDYDEDGLLDLVVSQYTYWNPAADTVCTTPAGVEYYCSPKNYKSVPHNLYRNEGNGRFRDVTEESGFARSLGKGMGISVADYDDDGHVDVFVANDTERNFLYMNKGNGTFDEKAWPLGVAYNDEGTTVSGMGSDAKDFNNDGWVDIFYNNLQTQVFGLFQNEAGAGFRYVSLTTGVGVLSRRFSGWSPGFVDYDNDGWKDLYSANGDVDDVGDNTVQSDTMWQNDRGQRFRDVSAQLGGDFLRKGYQRGSAFCDLDGNGFQDIVVTSLNMPPRILISSGGNGNHWLLVRLTGRSSNRDAIGAKIRVTTASGRVLHNHVSVSVGFMSSSEKRLHFGLGSEASVRSVEVRWPRGKVQSMGPTPADREIDLVEPE
jgi:enediyne biosynthesis protein E4